MADAAWMTEEDTRMVLETVRQIRSSGLLMPNMGRPPILPQPTPLYFTNVADEEIPAWACVQITGTEEIGGQNYFQVDQPADNDGSAGWFLFNGPRSVPKDRNGVAQLGPSYRAFKDTGTVTAGEMWQPVASQWYLEQDGGGQFLAAGEDDIAEDVLRIFSPGGAGGAEKLFFTPSGGIPAASTVSSTLVTPGSATCTCGEWSGTNIIPGSDTATVYNIADVEIAGNVGIKAGKVGGNWVVDVAGCGQPGSGSLQTWSF